MVLRKCQRTESHMWLHGKSGIALLILATLTSGQSSDLESPAYLEEKMGWHVFSGDRSSC